MTIHRICDALNRIGSQVANRDMCLVVTAEGAQRDRETIRASTNDLEPDIGLMAVDPDEETDIDLVFPDGEIRMVRVDFFLRDDLGILGTVVRHGDKFGRNSFRQGLDDFRLPNRLFIPSPQHEWTGENCRIPRLDQTACRFIDCLLLWDPFPHHKPLAFRRADHAPF